MRIAMLADPESPNALYRGIIPITALHAHGHEVRPISSNRDRAGLVAVRDVDLLHIHRFRDDRTQLLIREAKRHGAAVVWDDDDDIGSNPRGTIAHLRQGGLHRKRRLVALRRIFRVADLVSTPSAELAERFRALGATHVVAIENYIPGLFLDRTRPERAGVTIGWVAGGEHQYDAEQLAIGQVLRRVLEERPEVRVVSVGIGLGIDSDRYTHVKSVELLARGDDKVQMGKLTLGRREAGGIANVTAGFDVGIAPLADVAYNRARSNIKLKEYAAGGAAWLASPVGPYVGMGRDEGGLLVPDGDWHAALLRLVDGDRERRKLAKRGAKWVAGHTIENNYRLWEVELSAAVERARSLGRSAAST